MPKYSSIKKVVAELEKYGNFLGSDGTHRYFAFYDGNKNHYYDVDYLGTEPITIDKINVMLTREPIIDYKIPNTNYAENIQFGGF